MFTIEFRAYSCSDASLQQNWCIKITSCQVNYNQLLFNPKCTDRDYLFDQLEGGRKLLVFAHHKAVMDGLCEFVTSKVLKPLFIYC